MGAGLRLGQLFSRRTLLAGATWFHLPYNFVHVFNRDEISLDRAGVWLAKDFSTIPSLRAFLLIEQGDHAGINEVPSVIHLADIFPWIDVQL